MRAPAPFKIIGIVVSIRTKKRLINLAIVLANCFLFYFLARWFVDNIRLDRMIGHIQAVKWEWIVAATAINLSAMIFYSLRLGVLIDRSFPSSFYVTTIGFGLNSVLPFRLGELAKLYYAHRLFSLGALRILVAIMFEKSMDITFLSLLAAAFVIFNSSGLFGTNALWLSIFIMLVVILTIVIWCLRGHHLLAWLGRVKKLQPLMLAIQEQVRLHHIPRLLFFSAVIWTLNIAVVFVAFHGLLSDTSSLSIWNAVSLLLITVLAIALPTAPAGLGVFEAGIVAYLTHELQVGMELALVAAVIFHLAVTLPQVILTIVILLKKYFSRT